MSSLPATTRAALPASAIVLQVALCALWGFGQVATQVANGGISPVFHAGLRSLGATVLLLAWIAWRRLPVGQRDGTLGAGLGIGVLFALEFMCLYVGLNYTSAARATLMLYSAPFVVALGTHFLVPGERLNLARVAGLAAAFAGLVLAFADRLAAPDTRGLVGDGLCLAAAFFWGATTIVVKATPLRRALPEKTLLYQLAVSALVLLAGATLVGERGIFAPSPLIWAILAFQVVAIASVSYLAWFWLVSRHRATTLHAFTFLTPLFGVGFAHLLLGDPVTPALAGALALIAAGIVLVNRS